MGVVGRHIFLDKRSMLMGSGVFFPECYPICIFRRRLARKNAYLCLEFTVLTPEFVDFKQLCKHESHEAARLYFLQLFLT